ncbi:MAG: sulfotransferase family 2 domain-containing protein [Candidatus Poseidoniales archaeon]|jgi:hypothetical protein|tara:strand:- start:448 stop:1155 length:708 start_codon:yes stop_codon:yes gene_type:complete
MIVSHEHQFIFIKTRKTAGTSIEVTLSKECGLRDIITPIQKIDEEIRSNLGHRGPQNYKITKNRLFDNLRNLLGFKPQEHYNHSPAKLIRERIGDSDFNSYLKFCVVRNPWDRAVSEYYWLLNGPGKDRWPEGKTFGEFIQESKADLLSDSHIYTIDGKSAIDRFIKYENLDAELNECLKEIGISNVELPRTKSGTRNSKAHYSLLFDDESIKKITEICSWEILNLGYEFEDKRN